MIIGIDIINNCRHRNVFGGVALSFTVDNGQVPRPSRTYSCKSSPTFSTSDES